MARGGSRGFTLAELLMVVLVIGLLLALLLPSLGINRGVSHKTFCSANMKQVGLAMVNFEEAKGYFPGYVNRISNDPANPKNDLAASWAVMCLPYLEGNALWNIWTNPETTLTKLKGRHGSPYTLATSMSVFTCPNGPATIPGRDSLSYVVNCGSVIDAQHDSIDNRADGVCFNLYSGCTKVSQRYLRENHGLSTTLLVTENLQAQRWVIDATANECTETLPAILLGKPDADGWSATGQQSFKRWTGFVWLPTGGADNTWTAGAPASLRINGGKPYPTTPPSDFAYSRPSSNHAGGVNVVFCDNHTRFIKDDIDYKVYTQLMASNPDAASYNPLPPNEWKYVLDEKDY